MLPTQMFPRLPARAIFVSDFVQKHFVSTTNVSQFAQPKKHHGQKCVCNNVSTFTRAFRLNARQSKFLNEFPQKVSLRRFESLWCLFGNKKRFYKLFCICSGQILRACTYQNRHVVEFCVITLPVTASSKQNARQSKSSEYSREFLY